MEIKSRGVRCNTEVEFWEPTISYIILVARMSQQKPPMDALKRKINSRT
jgi:hypothetical protein